ncbi:hypothetical protein GDO78_019291 [Eleutherodactylus coqui]|uniref:Uncharacterized protein n=1 Tax=Eleutherodactylus coqui TaxID=57060 RepID=A0A8J6JUC3_ELECQ|nr:hypothetical protein GDO78_019291 [Eleutherodactylus coqui]
MQIRPIANNNVYLNAVLVRLAGEYQPCKYVPMDLSGKTMGHFSYENVIIWDQDSLSRSSPTSLSLPA